MRIHFAILCLALALAGCRGTTAGGMFGQMTIPPPSTQPPGALLADNAYYPGVNSSLGSSAATSATPFTPAFTASPSFNQDSTLQPNSLPSSLIPSGDSSLIERRGASLTKANLGGPARSSPSSAREEPIRIPDDSASAGTLASVIPIRGIPMTDATGLFEQIRSQLAPPASLATRPRTSSGFVEISQLPNPPADVRRAALSRQELR
ncbi:MAG: hypothetical protein ACKVP0_26895 [Pirellulaceae bacterium]